ncbi:helix-turn-helix transcriptional regulator [Vibrio alginolyticus]|uniref:helix-turn-helix transcriptional regulator n=1 Tax=Vibrio alginolyticus TaxID=663 RepID=UPI003D7EC316
MAPDIADTRRILRLKEVIAITQLSRATIYNKSNRSSSQYDPTFPQRIKLGVSAVGWPLKELDIWLSERIKMRDSNNMEEA